MTMCPQLISGPMPHLSCTLLKWTMVIPYSFLSAEKHCAALSDHLGCDGRHVQKSTGCLGGFGVIAIIPSERQQRKAGLASDQKLNRIFRFDI